MLYYPSVYSLEQKQEGLVILWHPIQVQEKKVLPEIEALREERRRLLPDRAADG